MTLKTKTETKFADGTVDVEKNVDEISFSKKGEFHINGDKLSTETLKQEYQGTDDYSPTSVVSSGGRDWLTYYEIENNPTTYFYKAYKEPSNSFLDPPSSGDMFHFYTYTKDADFQNLARLVGSARDNIGTAMVTLLTALGVITVTWVTVVSLITAGGTVGASALAIYNNSSSGKSYMLEAYNLHGS